jgi:hypothetical protein
MFKLYVVVEIETGAGLQLSTDVVEFDGAYEADIAYDNLMETHRESPVTRYEVTKLY